MAVTRLSGFNGSTCTHACSVQVPSDIEDEVTAERKRSHALATSSFQPNSGVQLVLEKARLEAKGSKRAKMVGSLPSMGWL